MEQHEIRERGPLLDERGHLCTAGYARELILDYDRKAIKANPLRIKEWDYYLVADREMAVALTIADNSYMGLDSISLIDFTKPWEHTNSPMSLLTLGKIGLPSDSGKGNVKHGNSKYEISFENYGDHRILSFHMDDFLNGKKIEGEIRLECPKSDSMVIVTPFRGNDRAFYYNQKINCMPAQGRVVFDGREHVFSKDTASAVLDWGRGVWTYSNTWYWGSLSSRINGIPFGFNIGYGFGDTSKASENMLFYNHKAHKLSQVTFNIPMKDGKEDYLSPWTFTSDDGRFEMDFRPIIDRASCTDIGIICSDQHQVFGLFSGDVILDDGRKLHIEDMLGFAEKVRNKW
ncbi:MAG: DUF2804 domain-containing protein [Erysipelotrichaceae bacterium]|nr:DUF2804 domain-containing protein [Erysipelotrichaceae bacterium]